MPSTRVCAVPLRHLATDFSPFYALIAIVQVVWLFIYSIGIAAFAHPQACDPGSSGSEPQQWYVTYILLGLTIALAAGTVLMALLTARGTPLEPSRRRWVGRLLDAFVASLVLMTGCLAWGGWVVLAGDGSCWSSGSKSMPNSIFFGGLGVPLGQAIGFAISYNQLCDVHEGHWFQTLTRTPASAVIHLISSYGARYRGPAAQLEMVLTALQGRLASISADKSDAAAALACASLVQDEAAAVASAAAIGSSSSKAVAGSSLLAWAESVCQAAAGAAGPPPGQQLAPAGEEAAAEALHWARFAAAAYGERQHSWQRGEASGWAASKHVSRLAAAAAAAGAQPLAGWGGLAAAAPPRAASASSAASACKAELRGFAAARELLGPSCEVVAMGGGSTQTHLPAHLLAVDREKQAVVLGIAGNWRRPHTVPDSVPVPAGWLAGSAAAAAEHGGACKVSGTGGGGSSSCVHRESLAAAQAVLAELERSQLLQQLLQRPSGGAASAGPLAALHCSGWTLVVAGHGVGAGAAALLAPKLAAAHLGPLEVWAFGPPGELCSADVGAAIAGCCRLTAVAVGDDAAPRTTDAAVDALLDQSMVGLARLRYPKIGLFAALAAERLGPQRWCWRGRWLTPTRALRPMGEAPAEALAYLQRYHDARMQQAPPAVKQPGLPGRLLVLSRVDEQAVTTAGLGDREDGSDGSSSEERWAAGWASGEQASGWGLRSSHGTFSDHYESRLLGVLGQLAAPQGGSAAVDGSAAEDSKQPLCHGSHTHSE